MLDAVLDVFRVKQYFDVVTGARELVAGARHDVAFVRAVRRAVVRLPFERFRPVPCVVFPPLGPPHAPSTPGNRIGIVATGGSGALASVVGVGRAFEDAGIRPSLISVCSGSALFGFPLAAGVPAEEVAEFTATLRPEDYVDPDWRRLVTLAPRVGRGFAGVLRGDRLEATYRRLLGDLRLQDLPIPCYAPIWNVEQNRVEYLGPRTHPELSVARAVRMAVALPLFFDPVPLDDGAWCDGGIVDIFPVRPVLEIESPPDAVIAVNGFYPPGFAGEDATGWADRLLSILHVASQVRTCQQIQLAREHLRRLEAVCEVAMIEPVPYATVQGVGFYREFLDASAWPTYMRAGRMHARAALRALAADGLSHTVPIEDRAAARAGGRGSPRRRRPVTESPSVVG
ncbi:MAG: patatin-like phospholipase family protein [Acidimicrobiia bacterium]